MAVARKHKTVKSPRYKSAGIGLLLVLIMFVMVTGAADSWFAESTQIEILVEQSNITTEKEIITLASVPDTLSLHEVDLLEIEKNVESNPFVKSAIVTTRPPRTIVITLTERTPFANLLDYNRKEWLIDEDGVVMPAMQSKCGGDMPFITGEHLNGMKAQTGEVIEHDGIQDALNILKLARTKGNMGCALISEVHIRKGNDIILYTTDSGIPVIFGGIERSSDKLGALFTFIADGSVNPDLRSIKYIDLRFKDQLVVQKTGNDDGLTAAGPTSTMNETL